jgi:hypothetical protein
VLFCLRPQLPVLARRLGDRPVRANERARAHTPTQTHTHTYTLEKGLGRSEERAASSEPPKNTSQNGLSMPVVPAPTPASPEEYPCARTHA